METQMSEHGFFTPLLHTFALAIRSASCGYGDTAPKRYRDDTGKDCQLFNLNSKALTIFSSRCAQTRVCIAEADIFYDELEPSPNTDLLFSETAQRRSLRFVASPSESMSKSVPMTLSSDRGVRVLLKQSVRLSRAAGASLLGFRAYDDISARSKSIAEVSVTVNRADILCGRGCYLCCSFGFSRNPDARFRGHHRE